ncbi:MULTISPECIES: hypothetical protein [unclassified Mycoplasma]|uniref:hypothetical protein n=1 Tax=unclassified Mycoplasma TaxID=2683645 RepID=UPI000FDE9270
MKLFSQIKTHPTTEVALLTRVFTWVAVSFGLICLVAVSAALVVDATGVLKDLGRYNFEVYSMFRATSSAMRRLFYLMISSNVLIMVSFILSLIWLFNWQRASQKMIYSVYFLYILSTGLGFGVFFALLRAIELVAIFGVSTLIFGAMALVGWYAKDLSKLRPFIITAAVLYFVFAMVEVVLYMMGIFSDTIYLIVTLLLTFFVLANSAYQIWVLRRTSEFYRDTLAYQSDFAFRFIAFMSFQILVSYVTLLMTVLRWYLYIRN